MYYGWAGSIANKFAGQVVQIHHAFLIVNKCKIFFKWYRYKWIICQTFICNVSMLWYWHSINSIYG